MANLGNATGMAWMSGHLCQVSAKGSLIYIYIYIHMDVYVYIYVYIYI